MLMGILDYSKAVAAGTAPAIARSSSTGLFGNDCGSTMSCTFSPAPASGVLMMAFIYDNTGVTPIAPTQGAGAAWTEIGSGTTVRCWYKIANGSESTSQDIVYYGVSKSDAATFSMLEVTGNFSTPIDSNSTSSASTAVSPSITTQFNFELVISFLADRSVPPTGPTIPAGWTLSRRDTINAGATTVSLGYKVFNTAGATGTATWGSSTSPLKIFTIGCRSV